jgi:hypothetical protein
METQKPVPALALDGGSCSARLPAITVLRLTGYDTMQMTIQLRAGDCLRTITQKTSANSMSLKDVAKVMANCTSSWSGPEARPTRKSGNKPRIQPHRHVLVAIVAFLVTKQLISTMIVISGQVLSADVVAPSWMVLCHTIGGGTLSARRMRTTA